MIFDAISKGGIDTSDATATASDILNTKTAYVDGEKITGEYVPLDTSDATATASDILNTKTAYVDGVKVTGEYVPLDTSDATATASDILNTKTAYVDGVKVTGEYVPLDTSDATATASDILNTKTAYVDGVKVTGSLVKTETKIDSVLQSSNVELLTFPDDFYHISGPSYYGSDAMTYYNNNWIYFYAYGWYEYNTATNSWEPNSSKRLPYYFDTSGDNTGSRILIINNEIHILSGDSTSYYTKHYKWNGSAWVSVSTLPGKPGNRPIVYVDSWSSIILMGTNADPTKCYALEDGDSTWHEMAGSLPYDPVGALCVSYESSGGSGETETYDLLLGGSSTDHSRDIYEVSYSINSSGSGYYSVEFEKLSAAIPFDFYDGACAILKDANSEQNESCLHIFGGGGDSTAHYHMLGSEGWEWVEDDDIPFPFRYGTTMLLSDSKVGIAAYVSGLPYYKTVYYQYDVQLEEYENYSVLYKLIISAAEGALDKKYMLHMEYDAGNPSGLCTFGDMMHMYQSDCSTVYEYDPINGGLHDTSLEDVWPSNCPYEYNTGMATPIGSALYGGVLHEFFNVMDNDNADYAISHFTWDGSEYAYIGSDTNIFYGYPESQYYASYALRNNIVVYQNELHVIGVFDEAYTDTEETPPTQVHYKLSGTSWVKVCDLPWTAPEGEALYLVHGTYAMICNGKIHLFSTSNDYMSVNYHYVYDGISWTQAAVPTLDSSDFIIGIMDCEDEIHMVIAGDGGGHIDGTSEIIYDEGNDSWSYVQTLAEPFKGQIFYQLLYTMYNGKLFMFSHVECGYTPAPYTYENGQWKLIHTYDKTLMGLIKMINN